MPEASQPPESARQPPAERPGSTAGAPGIRTGGTLTFLFSDIEGSTRLEQAVGTPAYAELRERHRALLRAAFAAADGAEQGTEGDSFFVVFRSARAGVAAAVAAQRALASEPWPPGAEVRVRMGIHSGEPEVAGGSLVGIDINRAARIAAAAHGGQVLVSDVTRSLVRRDIGDDIGFRDLGRHRLKDIAEAEHLHQVVAGGLPDGFPPVRSLDNRPNTLPTQLTSFVGREAEVAEARRLLAGTRLLTLTGPGGTGKTRLAIRVATEVADDFADGVFFVALDAVRDPGLVPSQIATAVGVSETGGRSAEQLLAAWLGGKMVLLVLDNFEQVVDAAPAVASLLRAAPGLKAIATSRAPLRISGEHEYPVPGLPTPPDLALMSGLELARLPQRERGLEADALAAFESVRLFIARATAVRPDFSVTNDNAPAVAAICARLRGMPLAIELAAARIRLLSPDAILARLTDQLGALGAGSRDLPERQQTLRGAIAWSYELLAEGDRRLLERLSAFRGGIDLAAAEAVCGAAPEIGRDVLDGLSELADQSLIRVVEGGEPRFAMLESIREFAGEMLADRPEASDVRRRFRAWFLAFAQRAAPELVGSEQRRWLNALELEHDNLRAAIERAVADEDADTAVGIAFALWRFWQMRGHLNEARRRLDAMAAAPWSHRTPQLRARLLEALGGTCWWQGDIAAMRAPYAEAVELWRAVGDRRELANALYNYAFCFSVQPGTGTEPKPIDPTGEGHRALDQALALYRELGDEAGQANVLWGIGNLHYFSGEFEASAAEFEEALPLQRRAGNQTMAAWSLHMLGSASLQLGQLDRARRALAEALRMFHASGDAGLTLVLDDFASLAAAVGDPERAARLWGAARSLTASTGTGLASFVDEQHEQFRRPSARAMLDPVDAERLAQEGAAMTLDEVVAYALEAPPPPAG